jgi:lipopolysaccharide/colanic/teichoic acid biosynthesis glycosyltransferase
VGGACVPLPALLGGYRGVSEMDISSSEQTVERYSLPVIAETLRENLVNLELRDRFDAGARRSGGVYSACGKRAFDVLAAAILLVLLGPLLAVIAFVIFCIDGLPVAFKSERIGRNMQPYGMLKYRTMRRSAEQMLAQWRETDDPLWYEYVGNNFKISNDPRILSFGAFLRRYSLDELPQLWNVLRGDMSIVGPRPMLPVQHEAEFTAAENRALRIRAVPRPGITGLWQVSGRSNTTFDQRLNYDAVYAERISFASDVEILFKTIGVVLSGEGAF